MLHDVADAYRIAYYILFIGGKCPLLQDGHRKARSVLREALVIMDARVGCTSESLVVDYTALPGIQPREA